MYQAYWGLSQPPFSAEAVGESLESSAVHTEALARLDFLRESACPFGLLLGPAGGGKTAVLTEFAVRAERAGTPVALVQAAVADELALLVPLAHGLKIDADGGSMQLWRRIADRFEELKLESLSAIVLLDDLDRAGSKVLLFVERLLALGAGLTIVGSGRPETARRIGPRLLNQVALKIDLTPWTEAETREYLASSMTKAGRKQAAFDSAATRRLFELSGGAPRKVNQLAQLALVAGAGQQLVQIDEATIEAVEDELSV